MLQRLSPPATPRKNLFWHLRATTVAFQRRRGAGRPAPIPRPTVARHAAAPRPLADRRAADRLRPAHRRLAVVLPAPRQDVWPRLSDRPAGSGPSRLPETARRRTPSRRNSVAPGSLDSLAVHDSGQLDALLTGPHAQLAPAHSVHIRGGSSLLERLVGRAGPIHRRIPIVGLKNQRRQ
jgi:hypothetical protein